MVSTHGLVGAALLQGLRAALLRQASEAGSAQVLWTLRTAHLINGGTAYVDDAVAMLRACGFELATSRKHADRPIPPLPGLVPSSCR